MNKLSKADEQRAMLALETAIKHANTGMDPSAAIVKAAQDAQLEAPMVHRLVEAFNVSKTLNHFKKAAGAERASTFPLASSESIMAELFPADPETPAKEAAAMEYPVQANFEEFLMAKSAEDYSSVLPPMVDKSPEPYARDPNYAATKIANERNKLVVLHKQAEAAAKSLYYQLLSTFDKAADYFKQTVPHEAFDLVEKRAYATYGPAAKKLMDVLVATGGLDDRRVHVKRASADELGTQQMSFPTGQEPYDTIADAMFLSKEIGRISKEAAAILDTIDEHAITNALMLSQPEVEASIDRQLQKRAKRDLPSFTDQDRPKKVKEIYRALKRDHPDWPAGKKARIASAAGA